MATIDTVRVVSTRIDPAQPYHHACRVCDVRASRCDLADGVEVFAPLDASPTEIARDVAQAFGFHGSVILPELPSFRGYDTVTLTIVRNA